MALAHDYPLSPPDLFATVTDMAYLTARHARFGGVGTPEVEAGDYLVVVRGSRQLPEDKIPGRPVPSWATASSCRWTPGRSPTTTTGR